MDSRQRTAAGGLHSIYINNKHGSLVYQKDFTTAAELTANDKIILASTFHGLSGIAAQLSPFSWKSKALASAAAGEAWQGAAPSDGSKLAVQKKFPKFLESRGIKLIESETFSLECYESMTGLRFFSVSQPNQPRTQPVLKKVYQIYADYVLKDPFHDVDMPIRCELFDKEIEKLFGE